MDDDIARSLPEPPPPRPARREAAIEAALQRFDARGDVSAGEPPRATVPRKPAAGPSPWWSRAGRPQLGALVSVALVALIGAPLAWMALEQGPVPISRETPPAAPVSPAPVAPVAQATSAPGPIARTAPPVTGTPTAPQPTKAGSPEVPLPPPPPPPPPPPAAVADNAPMAEPNAGGTAPPAPAVAGRMARTENRAAGITAREDKFVAAAPPPAMSAPPMAMAKAEMDDRANTDIAVTGSRVSRQKAAGRGDWNACTLNDPKRSLSGCRYLIDPGAKGPKGQAAARVADGLSRAWQGDLDGAISAFDQAVELQPRSAIAWLNRGLAWQRKGELGRAIVDLDQAVRYAPAAARGYYNRSLALRAHGDDRRASADEARAVDLDPDYEAVVR